MSKINGVPSTERECMIREIEGNFWEAWSNFGCGPGCTLHDEGDALWFETPIPVIPYNALLKFQVEVNVDRRIDQLVNHFNTRQVPFLWIVSPSSLPLDLPDRLQQRGLRESELLPGMARSLSDLPEAPPLPAGIEVREAVEETDVHELYELIAWRWGVPEDYRRQLAAMFAHFRVGKPDANLRMWLAWREGVPIAKVALFNGKGSAGIYGVVTKPEARGLGLARILMVEAMKAAREAGQELVVLHSSPLAESLYSRLGFVALAPLRLFASTAT